MTIMVAAQDDFAESDQAAMEWLAKHAAPGQLTRVAGALKMILDNSKHGEITILVRDGKIQGYPKVSISVS
jgi:hypothetical protein